MIIEGKDSAIDCPHCGEEQEGVVSDYSVSATNGRTYGSDTRAVERCGECCEWFAVSEIAEEKYLIEAMESEES